MSDFISDKDKETMKHNFELQKKYFADLAHREAEDLAKRLLKKAKRGFLKRIFSWFGRK